MKKIIIKNKSGMILEENVYDDNANQIYSKIVNQGEYIYDYDDNHNIIYSKFTSVDGKHCFESWQKYENNRLIYYKDSTEIESYIEYNEEEKYSVYITPGTKCIKYYDDTFTNVLKCVESNPDGSNEITIIFEYDQNGNLIHVKELNSSFEKFMEYNKKNQLVKSIDSQNRGYINIYDENDRKVKKVYNSGNELYYYYDGNGRLSKTVSSSGEKRYYEYR